MCGRRGSTFSMFVFLDEGEKLKGRRASVKREADRIQTVPQTITILKITRLGRFMQKMQEERLEERKRVIHTPIFSTHACCSGLVAPPPAWGWRPPALRRRRRRRRTVTTCIASNGGGAARLHRRTGVLPSPQLQDVAGLTYKECMKQLDRRR